MRYFIVTLQDHATAIECEYMTEDDGVLTFLNGHGRVTDTIVAKYNHSYWVSVHETDEATYLEAISEDGHDEGVH